MPIAREVMLLQAENVLFHILMSFAPKLVSQMTLPLRSIIILCILREASPARACKKSFILFDGIFCDSGVALSKGCSTGEIEQGGFCGPVFKKGTVLRLVSIIRPIRVIVWLSEVKFMEILLLAKYFSYRQ
jgi:hypothetical protein